jgi:hypothetical protein
MIDSNKIFRIGIYKDRWFSTTAELSPIFLDYSNNILRINGDLFRDIVSEILQLTFLERYGI